MIRTRHRLAVFCLVLTTLLLVAGLTGGDTHPRAQNCDSTSKNFDEQTALQNLHTPPRPILEILPRETTTYTGNATVFLICVVNPPENSVLLDPYLTVIHSPEKDNPVPRMVAVSRTVENGTRTNTLHTKPLISQMEYHCSTRIPIDGLHPGEAAQVPVIVTNSSPSGEYRLVAKVGWVTNRRVGNLPIERRATLHIDSPPTPPCGLFCTVQVALVSTVEFVFEEPVKATAIFTGLSLLAYIFGPENIRITTRRVARRLFHSARRGFDWLRQRVS